MSWRCPVRARLKPALISGTCVRHDRAAFFCIIPAWTNGAGPLPCASIVVILLSPRAEQAYAAAVSFLIGISLSAVLAATVQFAVLPKLASFGAFSVALGLVLVPAGASWSAMADRDIYGDSVLRTAAGAREPDELRSPTIL